MAQKTSRDKNQIQATKRSLKIIEEIRRRDGAGVTELADHFGHSKSTIHEHLLTLVNAGYLTNSGGTYKIGIQFLLYGGHARSKQRLFRLGKSEIDELAAETGESAKLVIEENGRGIYLYQARGDNAVRTDSHLGTQVYLHTTAVGKAILAHLEDDRVDKIVEQHGLPKVAPKTITSRAELDERLAETRDRGVAFDDEERIDGMRCVAAPICRDGEVLGSLSISGPTKRIRGDIYTEEIPKLVKNSARIIEINSKYLL